MKTTTPESVIHEQAKRLGYSIEECFSFEGCYFVLDRNTSIVVAGGQEFMSWDEVVRWVVEAGSAPTLQ